MKYLFVTQYFYPEEFRGNDIAFDWAKRGEHVTVITAIPNYPAGTFFKGYNLFKRRKEVINGVEVIRVPVIPRGKGNPIILMLNYFSFALFGSIYALFLSYRRQFDAVFVQQLSPIMIALPAIIVKKKQKIPLYLWVLDLWPESLTSGGNIQNKWVLAFFEYIVKFVYFNSDKILISSRGFESSIITKGNFSHKIIYFPNWAEDVFSNTDKYQIPILPNGFIVMFAGNIGEAQDFENVMRATLLLKNESHIKFVILGDGRKKAWVDEFCKRNELQNSVCCLGRFPLTSMPVFFEKADLMLISLKDEPIVNLTLPAKIQAYMTSCKPIVGMLNGDGARTIEESNCGLCVNAANYKSLASLILEMSNMEKRKLKEFAINGQNYSKLHFDKETLLNQLFNEILRNNYVV
jgi:glycosyltransferase involved in cell wall biosynthesis